MSNDSKEEEMICALTADEHVALQKGLRALPETMPPRDVWLRIREQAQAEGLLTQPSRRKHHKWYAGAGLAAAAVMAAVMMPVVDPVSTVVPTNLPSNEVPLDSLGVLQSYSRSLEKELRELPEAPRVARAGTVATISDIEDRIAGIDYQLNDPAVQMSDGDREIFWRERVRLMKLLLQLRYAQAQRAAY